jgi:tRNA(Ile)-lysidine synthase
LRGRSSDADERLVRTTARKLGLSFVAGRGDVRRISRRQGISVEMAGRLLRHDFLARLARRRRIRTIALAHQADDQVEHFFLRLLRGAGSGGLAGMTWRSPSPSDAALALIRPLLALAKQDLRQFAIENRVPYREDATNRSLDPLRNRIRMELLPLLEERYQPALRRTVRRVMDILSAEADCVTQSARSWLRTKNRPAFQSLPVALQRQCLRLQLQECGGAIGDFELIELLRVQRHVPAMVAPETVVWRDTDGRVHRRRVSRFEFNSDQMVIDLDQGRGGCQFNGVTIAWETDGTARPSAAEIAAVRLAAHKRSAGGADHWEFFDADKVGSPVTLRHWARGDRFQPIGLATSVKLQDWFTNRKVPRARRHELLLAATVSGEVFWVEGERIGERFKLDKTTVRLLKWAWQRG